MTDKHPIYASLDPEIAPLIEAMNRHDWLDTVSSCFGHEGHEFHDHWHVAFWCRHDMIGTLCLLLNRASSAYPGVNLLDLQIVWHDEVAEAQFDAGPDWLSLNLTTIPMYYMSKPERVALTEQLTAAFNELAAG